MIKFAPEITEEELDYSTLKITQVFVESIEKISVNAHIIAMAQQEILAATLKLTKMWALYLQNQKGVNGNGK